MLLCTDFSQISAILASDLPTRRKRDLCNEQLYGKDSVVDMVTAFVDADPSVDEKKKNETDLEIIKLMEGLVSRYYERQRREQQIRAEIHSEIESQVELQQPPNI